jgi:ATP-dependent DNA helicase RecG
LLKENQHIEFKTSFNDAVIETVSAFVNTKGGKIYIGVDDFGQPIPNFSIGKESIQNWRLKQESADDNSSLLERISARKKSQRSARSFPPR